MSRILSTAENFEIKKEQVWTKNKFNFTFEDLPKQRKTVVLPFRNPVVEIGLNSISGCSISRTERLDIG
jgi:hypothetical protein